MADLVRHGRRGVLVRWGALLIGTSGLAFCAGMTGWFSFDFFVFVWYYAFTLYGGGLICSFHIR